MLPVDKCHRSKQAWIRQTTLPDRSEAIGKLRDDYGNVDLSFACSRPHLVHRGGRQGRGDLGDPESIHGIVRDGRSEADNDSP